MESRAFRGPDLAQLLAAVRLAFGEDALVVSTRGPAQTGGHDYEVIAAPADAILPAPASVASTERPLVVALVGPPGGGKTTTAVKLALNPFAYGGRSVGLLTLDTFRAAGIEQLGIFAEIAGIPLEIAYTAEDVDGAIDRLGDRDVVIIDTPGRGTGDRTRTELRALLAAASPNEVHLVLPAGLRSDVAMAARDAHRWCGVTHLLLTQVDEVPGRSGISELRHQLGLPVRWTASGQEVPSDLNVVPLRAAPARVAKAL